MQENTERPFKEIRKSIGDTSEKFTKRIHHDKEPIICCT